MSKGKKRIIIVSVVLVLLFAGLWWLWGYRANAQVRKVQEMQKEMAAEDLTPEARREKWEQLRREMDRLTPEQREEVMRPMREQMERRMDEHLDEYFALPPNKRKEYLDKQIKEMEQRRKEWEARRAQQGNQNSGRGAGQGGRGGPGPMGFPPDGGPPPFGPPPGQNAQGPAPGGAAQPASPGPRGPRNLSPEARLQRRNQRLDRTTPAQRAKRAEFMAAMQKRRAELGLPAFPMGGRGGR